LSIIALCDEYGNNSGLCPVIPKGFFF
jgi:hypothetical protein